MDANIQNRFHEWLENTDLQHIRQIYAYLCHLPDSAEYLNVRDVKQAIKDFLKLDDGG